MSAITQLSIIIAAIAAQKAQVTECERRQSAAEQAAQQSRNELKAMMTSTEEELKKTIKEKEDRIKVALNAAREADEAKVRI